MVGELIKKPFVRWLGAALLGLGYLYAKSAGASLGSALTTRILGNGTLGEIGDLGASQSIINRAIAFLDDAAQETRADATVSQQFKNLAQLGREGKLFDSSWTDAQIMLQVQSLVGAAPVTRQKVELYMVERGVTGKGGGQAASTADVDAAKAALRSAREEAGSWLSRPVVKIGIGLTALALLGIVGIVLVSRRGKKKASKPAGEAS